MLIGIASYYVVDSHQFKKNCAGLLNNPPDGILAGPISDENFFQWEAVIAYVDVLLVQCFKAIVAAWPSVDILISAT